MMKRTQIISRSYIIIAGLVISITAACDSPTGLSPVEEWDWLRPTSLEFLSQDFSLPVQSYSLGDTISIGLSDITRPLDSAPNMRTRYALVKSQSGDKEIVYLQPGLLPGGLIGFEVYGATKLVMIQASQSAKYNGILEILEFPTTISVIYKQPFLESSGTLVLKDTVRIK